MAYDVTLGGQNFTVDNPNQILGLLDNFMKLQMEQQLQQKQEEEKQSLLQTLQKYNLTPAEEGPPKTFEEMGSRYQGTTGEYDKGGYPVPKFSSGEGKPQITNLRQLVDVIQGLKGLPPEYASEIVGRLTGIADPSVKANENLLKLRMALQEPYKAETANLRRETLVQRGELETEKLSQQKELTIKRLKANYLSNIIKNSPSLKERQSATEEFMKLLVGGGEGEDGGVTPQFTTKWTTKAP